MIEIYKTIASLLIMFMVTVSAYSIGSHRGKEKKTYNAGLLVIGIYIVALIAIWI